jgi:S-adenosyl-L-methionine hydrolase (adenosine-forming)
MSGPVFLLSDFGLRDSYVAQMKSILYSGTPPGTALIDLTHEVEPGGVLEGAFHLFAAAPHMPAGSVVAAVVDPGVGTDRPAVAVHGGGITLVGPDNGLFSFLPLEYAWELPPLPPGSSSTFHGRDLFARAAARLTTDPGWTRSLRELDPGRVFRLSADPEWERDGTLRVSVMHVDRFGNIILWLRPGTAVVHGLIQPEGGTIPLNPVRTYAGGEGLLLLEGSLGLMEIALDGASAGRFLGVSSGSRLSLAITP